ISGCLRGPETHPSGPTPTGLKRAQGSSEATRSTFTQPWDAGIMACPDVRSWRILPDAAVEFHLESAWGRRCRPMVFPGLADILRSHARARGSQTAMIAGDRTWTYRELRDESARVCQALAAEGVGEQDRVAVLDKNGPEFFAVLFGSAMLRAVTLPVNWR